MLEGMQLMRALRPGDRIAWTADANYETGEGLVTGTVFANSWHGVLDEYYQLIVWWDERTEPNDWLVTSEESFWGYHRLEDVPEWQARCREERRAAMERSYHKRRLYTVQVVMDNQGMFSHYQYLDKLGNTWVETQIAEEHGLFYTNVSNPEGGELGDGDVIEACECQFEGGIAPS